MLKVLPLVRLRFAFLLLAVLSLFFVAGSAARAEVLVQVMSIQDQAAAQTEVDRLLSLGAPAFQRAEQVPDKGVWNRVYVGPFASQGEAQAVGGHMKEVGLIRDFIIKADSGGAAAPPPPGPVGSGAPVIIGGTEAPVIIGAPAGPPVSPAPTYGEPLSPDTAAQRDLNAAPPAPLKVQGAEPMKIKSFSMLVDLSSSMRNLSPCQGMIKEETVAALLRKMNQRIPRQPYTAALRVFGYKQSWTREDYTTLYYGPEEYDRDRLDASFARLQAADSTSPFGSALEASSSELSVMEPPAAILMFADYEDSLESENPVARVRDARRRHGSDHFKVYTYRVSRQSGSQQLAQDIAKAGQGRSYEICRLLADPQAFEDMMMEIFGPAEEPPCSDQDGDSVCDTRDICPNTPKGAPVDERGCWIAAYSQFFDFDKAEVKSAFHPRLEYAAEILNNNLNLPKVIIAGHTDGIGTDQYNQDLGRRRAEAVKALLVESGVDPGRLEVESFGKSQPIADNDTEEGRAKNRRVEFHIGDVPRE